MNDILASLYNCAMSSRAESYLIGEDIQNLRSAIRGKENRQLKLQELLDENQLTLLERYIDQSSGAAGWEFISAFRKGLAIGLKLGAFCIFGTLIQISCPFLI